MHRLFGTQELVTTICNCLYVAYGFDPGAHMDSRGAKPFKRTGLVSTHFFYGMLPYIWEHIKVRDLFKLPAKLTGQRGKTRVRISELISPETMARFHFYAPYIKVLHVPIWDEAAEVSNWEPLSTYAKDNELLPNLVGLECEEFDLQAISVFLSGSTQKVTISRPAEKDSDDSDSDSSDSDDSDVRREGLDMTSTRQLLEHAARKCTSLCSLEFHPESDETIDAPTSLHTFNFLSSFKNLCRLVSTPVVLQSAALQLVAKLPNLNTLSIKPSENSGHWDSSLCEQVLAGSFPVLSGLTLILETSRDAKRFWELVPLRALKRLSLTIISSSSGDESQFIPALCRTSPLITELRLKFDKWSPPITVDMFEHLACLPIESCSFVHTRLYFGDAWVNVASSWRELRSIECSDQWVDLDELLFLSSNLPKLENISCHLNLSYATSQVGNNWLPAGRPPFYPNLRHLNPLSSGLIRRLAYNRELRGLARFFAYFWPNLDFKYIEEDRWQEYADDDEKDLRRMNQEILADKQAMFAMFKELILAYVHLFHPDLVGVSRDV